MIASIRGTVTYTTPQLRKDSYVVIEAGGVGYKIFIPAKDIPQFEAGKTSLVYTFLSVSEHAQDLYGFLQPSEKTFFVLLLSVPSIGPKSALAILDKATMQEVQEAVMADDPKLLVTMAGLSLKTAEKIVVALKDKLASLTSTHTIGDKRTATGQDDAFAVLLTFGYSAAEAREVLGQIGSEVTDTSNRVRAALKLLSKKSRR